MNSNYARFVAPSYTEFLGRCPAHNYFRSRSKRGKPLNSIKTAMVWVNSQERILRTFFRNTNGTYRRFWDLSYKSRDWFFKTCRDYNISKISVLVELSERLTTYGEETNREY